MGDDGSVRLARLKNAEFHAGSQPKYTFIHDLIRCPRIGELPRRFWEVRAPAHGRICRYPYRARPQERLFTLTQSPRGGPSFLHAWSHPSQTSGNLRLHALWSNLPSESKADTQRATGRPGNRWTTGCLGLVACRPPRPGYNDPRPVPVAIRELPQRIALGRACLFYTGRRSIEPPLLFEAL